MERRVNTGHATVSRRTAIGGGLIALSPLELPVMQAPAPAAAPKPLGMSLPMA